MDSTSALVYASFLSLSAPSARHRLLRPVVHAGNDRKLSLDALDGSTPSKAISHVEDALLCQVVKKSLHHVAIITEAMVLVFQSSYGTSVAQVQECLALKGC